MRPSVTYGSETSILYSWKEQVYSEGLKKKVVRRINGRVEKKSNEE